MSKKNILLLFFIIFIALVTGYTLLKNNELLHTYRLPDDSKVFEAAFRRLDNISYLISNTSITIPETNIEVKLRNGKAAFFDNGKNKVIQIIGRDTFATREGGILSARRLIISDETGKKMKYFFVLFKYKKSGDVSLLGYNELKNHKNFIKIRGMQKVSGVLVIVDYSTKPPLESIKSRSGVFSQVYKLKNGEFVLDNSIYRKIHPN